MGKEECTSLCDLSLRTHMDIILLIYSLNLMAFWTREASSVTANVYNRALVDMPAFNNVVDDRDDRDTPKHD